jgi:hypothetical protein
MPTKITSDHAEQTPASLNFDVGRIALAHQIDQLRAFGYGEVSSPNPARYAFIASPQTSTFDAFSKIASLGAATLIWWIAG